MNKLLILILFFLLFTLSASAIPISTEYGNGWQKVCYSDGKCSYSNVATYLRWDNQWMPMSEINIITGDWSYTIQDLPNKMNFTADGRTISIPKNNTKFNLELFKISPSLTYPKSVLIANMINVPNQITFDNITYPANTLAYITFPYSVSQIKDYADENNIRFGRWKFQAGKEHINIFDDNTTINTLNNSYYAFKIINDEIRIYFVKNEANKLQGNITFQMNSWTIGSGGSAWNGNISKDNVTLNRDTNNIMLRQEVDDYISYWRLDGNSGTTAYDENITTNNNGNLVYGVSWNSVGKYGNSLTFDGINGIVGIPANSLYNNNFPFSVSFWVKPNTINNNRGILTFGEYGAFPFLLVQQWTTNVIRIYVYDAYIYSSGSLTNNTWNYITITRNNTGQGYIYINGVINGTISQTGLTTYNADSYIGRSYYSSYPYFSGLEDDVSFYARELTQNEIYLKMNNTMKSNGNITAWYDAGVGNVTYQVIVNATTDANSNYTVWYADNGTGSWTQLGGILTGDNILPISGTKYQNTDVQIRLVGNTTSTPEIMTVAFWSEPYVPPTPTSTTPTPTSTPTYNPIGQDFSNFTQLQLDILSLVLAIYMTPPLQYILVFFILIAIIKLVQRMMNK